ncbi:g7887 [Coccomyxa elongata]
MANIEKKQRENRDGTDKKKRKKTKLKTLYAAEHGNEILEAQPASTIIAVSTEPEEPDEDGLAEPRSIFLDDKRPYEPGAGFVLRQEEPSLSCSGLDPNTHEIWLLQLPLNWDFKLAARARTKPRNGEGVLGQCSSETGVEYSLVQEHASLAAPLFVASPTLKDGKPAQVQRRVTLVRSSSSTGEEEIEAPSAQQRPAGPLSAAEPETPKRKKAKVVHQGAQQPGAVELRLEDIMVKQESPDGKEQQGKKKEKKRKKDRGTSGGVGIAANP